MLKMNQNPACILCSIKRQALIHVLLLSDSIKADMDFCENIYKLTRDKVKDVRRFFMSINYDTYPIFPSQIGSELVCLVCKKDLKIVETFRQNCLYSEELMHEISSNISDNHRVLIENVFIDVTLFEGLEEFYVSPINVIDKCLSEEILEESKGLTEIIEEIASDDVVYDPIDTNKEESITTTKETELERSDLPKPTKVTEEITSETTVLTKPKEKITFKCDKCKKQYVSLSSLDMHRWKCHKIPIPTQLKRRQKLDISSEKDIYYGLDLTKTCEYCFKECNDYEELKIHLETSHKELPRKYTCKVCHREFKTRETLRTHFLAIHTDERSEFKCGYENCDRSFFHKRSLQSHEEIQHLGINAGRFICDLCGQKSNSRGDLNRHKLRHEKIKAHECPYQECGKR